MAEDTNKGQTNNPDQRCYTNTNQSSEDAAAAFRQFIRDPRTVFKAAPQMPDPVRGLSDNLDQLCYPSQAPISLESFFPEDQPLPLPQFDFFGPLTDLCKYIPELCDKLPKQFTMDWDGTKPCLVVDGEPCVDPTDTNNTPSQCIQNAINCIFKPYTENGGWTPTAADAETFFPPGFNKNQDDKVCILNCVPERIPVFELKYTGGDGKDYYYTTDENDVPSNYTRMGFGTGGIKKISFSTGQSSGTYNQSSWKSATIDRTVKNEAGALWWPSEPKKKYHQAFGFGSGGATIELIVAAIPQGSDTDTRYVLKEIENPGSGYNVGDTFAIRSPYTNAILGYIRVDETTNQQPAFWILKGYHKDAVPLYHYFSDSKRDSFLTTDPAGEANRISNGSYVLKSTLGYVFQNNEKISGTLCEDEIGRPLYRYYNNVGTAKNTDHRYSIVPLAVNERLKVSGKRNVYELPTQAFSTLRIRYKAQRGTAGKKSSWGFYLAKSDGIPVEGYVLRRNMTDSFSSGYYDIPISKLNEYAEGQLGFFMLPDAATSNSYNPSLADGSTVTFQQVSLNNNRKGYVAKINGTTLYTISGVPGNSQQGENYVFFSNRDLNPDKNDWTKWSGKWQGWEDWAGGDNDFDDVKINYNVKWNQAEDYKAEGVQCYVYRYDRLPKVYMNTQVRSGCEEDRLFKTSFLDPILHRLGCGSNVDGTNKSGSCTGPYVVQTNCDQTINVRMDGEVTIYSWGIDVIGETEETRWVMKLSVNGNYILNDVFSSNTYPKKGRVLHPAMALKKGDVLRFELSEIQVASYNGIVWPKISFYDEASEIHESIMTMTLRSGSTDEKANNFTPSSGTGIKQITITDSEGNNGVIGWDNGATQTSLLLNIGDDLWRSVKKNDRDDIVYQRALINFTKTGVNGIVTALAQVRFAPTLDSVTKRYKTNVTIEQLLFAGKGYAVGDELTVDFPTVMYYGSTRIPTNKKIKIKLKVTGVTT